MLPGTKPVPQRLKDMRGNPGQRRIRQERRPHPLPEVPEPPPHLSGLAAEEWSRVTPQLHCVGIFKLARLRHARCVLRGLHGLARGHGRYPGRQVTGSRKPCRRKEP